MIALVYVSDDTLGFDDSQLYQLAEDAGLANARNGITGYLYHEKKSFLQYIEGEAAAIDHLIEKIVADARHQVLATIRSEELKERRFPNWSMEYLSKSHAAEIRMENLLMTHIAFINTIRKKSTGDMIAINDEEDSVWKMVDRLAQLTKPRGKSPS